MIALEDAIVKDRLHNNIIKFYFRYVDDTLVLAKPSDINLILDKLNSYHPDIQFTHEEFIDKNDVHFLDIKFTSDGTTIFRKNTHTGQYIHLSSFTTWSYIRSLVNRVHKMCSDRTLLSAEINNILKPIQAGMGFLNGFPPNRSNKWPLIQNKLKVTLTKRTINNYPRFT